MEQPKEKRTLEKDYRFNIKMHSHEELQLYRDAKGRAGTTGETLRAFVLEAIRLRLAGEK